jgi:hypothetical protein
LLALSTKGSLALVAPFRPSAAIVLSGGGAVNPSQQGRVRDALEWRTQIGAGDTSTDFEDCSSGSDCLNPYAVPIEKSI